MPPLRRPFVNRLEPLETRHELLMEQDRFRMQALAAFDAFVPGTPIYV